MAYTRNLINFLPITDENFIITRVFRKRYAKVKPKAAVDSVSLV